MVGMCQNQGWKHQSNSKGRMVNIIDLPYPLGKETKVSLPDTKLSI